MGELKRNDISYVFLGRQLGARSNDESVYVRGKVQFNVLASTRLFQEGLQILHDEMRSHCVAIMCSEKDPITCHRMVLVAHALRSMAVIKHIIGDGSIEDGKDAEKRLLKTAGINPVDLFLSEDQLIELAYESQSQKIAYFREKEGK